MIQKLILVSLISIAVGAGVKPSLTIYPFVNKTSNNDFPRKDSDQFIYGLSDHLVSKMLPFFNVVEKERMSDLFSEIELGESGIIEKKEELRLGHMDGANLMLTGTLTDYTIETEKGVNPVPWSRKTQRFIVTFKIINIEKRRILFSDSIEAVHEIELVRNAVRDETGWPALARTVAEQIGEKMVLFFDNDPGSNHKTFKINLVSNPSEVNVDMGEITVGRTPLSLDLKSGIYTLRLYKSGYVDDVFKIKVDKEQEFVRDLEKK